MKAERREPPGHGKRVWFIKKTGGLAPCRFNKPITEH
jgi:hypothetical protein